MIELTGRWITAVPYRNRRQLKPRRLPDGAIVEEVPKELRSHAPKTFGSYREFPWTEGSFIKFAGLCLLSTGEVAAIYGTMPLPLRPFISPGAPGSRSTTDGPDIPPLP